MARLATITDLLMKTKKEVKIVKETVDFIHSGCDLDGDILYKSDGTPVYVNHEAIYMDGFRDGEKAILEHLRAYLEADDTIKNKIYSLLFVEAG